MLTNNDAGKVCNARDLVARILNHPSGSIDALLRLAEDQETDWLECKAALHPVGGSFKPNENADDYEWHVAKAAVALANSCGGVVLLGLDDALCPIGLTPSDPRGILASKGREAFNRDVVLAALIRACWKTGRSGTITLQGSMERLIEIRNIDYQGQPLAAILVTPVPDDDLLEVCETRNHHKSLAIPIRAHGAVGQVRDLQGRKEIRDHEQVRANQLRGDRYAQLWQRFLTGLPADTAPTDLIDTVVENALADYNAACVKNFPSLRDLFTPLDLEETRASDAGSHVGEFVPEADEWRDLFASDDPWDVHELDGDDDDEEGDDADIEDAIPEQPVAPPRRGSVFDLLAQEPRAILLGEPGAGKSTCLQRLALERAEGYRTGAQVTLYVPLRHYTEEGLRALLARSAKQPWPVLDALIRAERLRLLLDAVNECPRHLQERCCQDIKSLLDAHPNLPVWLTARNLSYRCQLRLPTFIVRPLDQEQQQRFLTAYLQGDVTRAAELLDRIQSQPGGALIASNPLLLRIVVEVSRAEGELPRGRALLYRRFFEDWYQREVKKEAHTGAPLRWSFPRTLEALATLALAARQAGRIEMERAWAERTLRPLLADDAVPFLERMAQGLLLRLDADQDSLSFNHESVQEYLAAEALVRQPEALADVPEGLSSSWRMTLAYAFELQPHLPASLVREAWRREPLLVAVALRDEALLASLPIAEDGNPWLTGVLRTFKGESCDAESMLITRNLLYPPIYPLPESVAEVLSSQAFWYAGLSHNIGIQRTERLRQLATECEEPWLDLLSLSCKNNQSWKIKLSSSHANFIQCVETACINCNLLSLTIPQISFLRRKDLLRKSKINSTLKQKIINNAEPNQLLTICPRTWRSDIPVKRLSDIRKSIAPDHLPWIFRGLLRRNEINEEIISSWREKYITSIESATTFQINVYLTLGLISYSDISIKKRSEIIQEMEAQDVTYLLSRHFITLNDIPENKKLEFINQMNPENASRLVSRGVIRVEDIPELKRQELISAMTATDAPWLIKNGIAKPNEIPELKRQELINEMIGENASRLIWQGIVDVDDLTEEKRQQLLEQMTPKNASWLVRQGVFKSEEIPDSKRNELISKATAFDAPWLLKQGIISISDLSQEKKNEIIEQIMPNNLQPLLKSNLISAEEIPEHKRQDLIKKAFNLTELSIEPEESLNLHGTKPKNIIDFKLAADFIVSGILNPEEIEKIYHRLIDQLTPASAQWMVSMGILDAASIPDDKRKDLIKLMNAEQCDWLVHHRVIRPDDIPLYKKQQFLTEIDAYRARWLIGQGIINPTEISEEKKASFIAEMNFEDALWLIKQGVFSSNQIPESRLESLAADAINQLLPHCLTNNEKQTLHQSDQVKNNGNIDVAFGLIDVGVIKPNNTNINTITSLINSDYVDVNKLATLISKGFISPSQVNKEKISSLLGGAGAAEKRILIDFGLLTEKDLTNNVKDVYLNQESDLRYTKEEIQEEPRRFAVKEELENTIWEMVVTHLNPDGSSGFASQPNFAWNIFFVKDRLIIKENIPLRKGDTLQAEIGVIFNRKRNEWSFAIKSGKRIRCSQKEIPKWWQAWQFFAPRWEMAAEGQYLLQQELFNKLQSEGFNTKGLRNWKPNDKEGRRIKLANHLVQLALNEPPDQLPLRKEHISQQLAGDGVWADLRQLAEAYIDGKRMLYPLKTAPISKSSVFDAKPAPANRSTDHSSLKDSYVLQIQKRRLEGNRLLSDFRKETKALVPRLIDFAEFIGNSIEFTIYIDESWSGLETAIKNNEGVIAGLICRGGPGQLFSDLPSIATHSPQCQDS